jgi:hypothetical protein
MQGNTYVANCTQQNQQLNFRLPLSRKPFSNTIPMGKQMLIGDLDAPSLDALRDQLGKYGLVHVDEASRSKVKITYLYAVGRPVKAEEIVSALRRNRGLLTEEGKERRLRSAVAANNAMNTEDTPLLKLETSIEEESSGSIPSEEPIAEGVRIDNTLETSENKPKRAPRSGGKKKSS